MFGKKRAYLDYAASVPATSAALRAFNRAASLIGNPSSPHHEGREAKKVLEESRTSIARLIAAKGDDIIFTSGATEANAIAISGLVMKRRSESEDVKVHVLYLPSSHASTVKTVRALAEYGVEAEALVIKDGQVDIAALALQIRRETVLVAMDLVCGETGTLWNTREVSHALRSAREEGVRIHLHVDASQAPLTELIERTRIGADTISLDAQKIGGVRGTGVLVAPRILGLEPLMHGGGQERGLRPGTENVAGAAAFARAFRDAQEKRELRKGEWARMRENFIKSTLAAIPDALVNAGKDGVPHIVNLTLPGRDTDYLVALLDVAGFAISTKSACESDSEIGSRAVLALTGDEMRASSTLRISWGTGTSARDLARFARSLATQIAFLDRNEK